MRKLCMIRSPKTALLFLSYIPCFTSPCFTSTLPAHMFVPIPARDHSFRSEHLTKGVGEGPAPLLTSLVMDEST